MNATVKEWLAKAQGDFGSARLLLEAGDASAYDAACFHFQQCVEKMLKACLINKQAVPPKIHDLFQLSELLHGVEPNWTWKERDLRALSRYAVAFRYPGRSATKTETRRAAEMCAGMRAALLEIVQPAPKPRKRKTPRPRRHKRQAK